MPSTLLALLEAEVPQLDFKAMLDLFTKRTSKPFLRLRLHFAFWLHSKGLVPGTESPRLLVLSPLEYGDVPVNRLSLPCLILPESSGYPFRLRSFLSPPAMGTVLPIPSGPPLGCLLETLQPFHLVPNLRASKLISLTFAVKSGLKIPEISIKMVNSYI